jgi:hypothetical protein
MRISLMCLLMVVVAPVAHAQPTPVAAGRSALDTEEVAVYQALFSHFSEAQHWNVILATTTLSLHIPKFEAVAANGPNKTRKIWSKCLEGIELPEVREVRLVRSLPPELIEFANATFAKAREGELSTGSGKLTVSEIIFDRERKHAIVHYEWVCGGLCGQSVTTVFLKVDDEWRPTSRMCEFRIS